jgi:uncharacterized membrane protein YsdA (DUF1294 family)
MIKIVGIWYLFTNLLLFSIYGVDKKQAIIRGRRIPEKFFHYLAAAGGFIGGILGLYFFRHKTQKPLFLWILSISAGIHIVIWFALLNY